MRKLPLLLFVPLFLMGCASGANTGDQMAISDGQSMTETAEETRLADDVGEDDDWTDTPEEAPAGPDMPAPLRPSCNSLKVISSLLLLSNVEKALFDRNDR